MKKTFILLAFLSLCMMAFAQDTTSVSLDYVSGSSIGVFFTENWGALLILVWAVASDLLGESKSTSVNSVFGVIKQLLKLFVKK